MRFLVVDSNLPYAGMVKDFLERHFRDATVDVARNAPIMRRRMRMEKYDIVIADILNSMDCEEMQRELESSNLPVILWSFIDPGKFAQFANKLHIFRKPQRADEIVSTVKTAIGSDPNLQAVVITES